MTEITIFALFIVAAAVVVSIQRKIKEDKEDLVVGNYLHRISSARTIYKLSKIILEIEDEKPQVRKRLEMAIINRKNQIIKDEDFRNYFSKI